MVAVILSYSMNNGLLLFGTEDCIIVWSIGRRYVDQLTDEVWYLCNGTYPAKRILVFGSVILQSDRSAELG